MIPLIIGAAVGEALLVAQGISTVNVGVMTFIFFVGGAFCGRLVK